MNMKKLALLSTCSVAALMVGCSSDSNGSKSKSSANDCKISDKCIQGDILSDLTITAGDDWILKGIVNVGDGAKTLDSDADIAAVKEVTLTIEPGAHIRADGDGVLIVNRGSKIMAEGTAANPITFSSQSDDDFDGLGEWGGVVVQGYAPQNAPGSNELCHVATGYCNVQGEGGSDTVKYYGGEDEDDNSGIIKYVRIAEAGKVAGPGNEVNGLTLQGVGYGTTVEYVQVHNNLDDGVEWFGGTVNAKYLVLTGNDDDDIDFDEGYVGNIQYALVIKDQDATAPQGSNDPRGIEANSSDDDSVEATNAVLSNITIIGSDLTSGTKAQPAMRLRGDLTVQVHNTVVSDYNGDCLRIDNGQDEITDVTFSNILVGNCGAAGVPVVYKKTGSASGTDAIPTATLTNVTQKASNASLSFNANWAATDAAASLAGVATPTAAVNGSGFTFEGTDYMGAVDPDATAAWWSGWTIPGSVPAP